MSKEDVAATQERNLRASTRLWRDAPDGARHLGPRSALGFPSKTSAESAPDHRELSRASFIPTKGADGECYAVSVGSKKTRGTESS